MPDHMISNVISKVPAKDSAKRSPASGAAKVKRIKLKNGLSVLLMENHKSPVVSVQMWVKTGSADERKGEEGISHFIEHLVFKGTEKFGVGEIASTVEAAGGELNAYTSFDQTVFYVNISREFSDVALEVISEMMGFPKFDSREIDNEREVVIEEIKRSNDSPSRQASRLLFSSVFKTHPYGIPVIGYDRIIRKVSRKTLFDYYTSRYVPKNMHLVVAGDFDAREMAEKIDATFGRLNVFKLRKAARKSEPKQAKARLKVATVPFEEAQFHLAWRIPGASHKDIAALDVLAMILGQGESSRLSQKLRMESTLMTSVGVGTFTPKDGGIITVSGTLNPDQIGPAFDAMRDEMVRFLSEPPTVDELKRAITNLESEEFYAMETIEGIARKAGSLENLMGDYAYFQKFLKQVYALKPEDILKAARKYLTAEAMTLVMTVPRKEKEASALLRKWMTSFAKGTAVARKRQAKPTGRYALKKVKWSLGDSKSGSSTAIGSGAVEKVRLSSGAVLIFRPNQATPVLSAKAAFLGGMRVEDNADAGVTELLSRVWTSGTKTLSEAEIQRKIEALAGGIGAFGGRNSAGLSLQAISPFEDEMLEIFGELLVEPVIAESVVEREKIMMLETLRSREDNPGQLASQNFIEAMFKGHPYERDLYGSPDSVKSLDKSKVQSHLGKMARSGNLMLAIAGAVDKSKWVENLEASTSRLAGGSPFKNEFRHEGPAEDISVYKPLEREQTHIIIGYKGLTLSDPKRYVLQVIQSILAGQGGRLFLELRDKASLAYSVSPMRMEGVDTGYFGAYIGCSPEKGEKSIAMLREEFKKLTQDKVGEVELDRAKRYLIGRHDIDLQRNSAISSSILFNEIYGIESAEVFAYADRLKNVTSEDVRALATEIFSRKHVLSAVGPRCPW